MESRYGVYAYLSGDEVVYIGKDKSIDLHKRHKEHFKASLNREQWIDIVLQKEELKYVVLATAINEEIMNTIESVLISEYQPKYNVRIPGLEKQRKEEYERWKENFKD